MPHPVDEPAARVAARWRRPLAAVYQVCRLILVNLLVLVALVAALEAVLRLYVHVSMPGKSFFRETGFTSPWFTTYDDPPPRYDAAGHAYFVHRTTPTTPKKDDQIRIMTVGGSTTVNMYAYATSGLDYQMILERLLNEAEQGRRHEVLNAGADAYSSAHSLVNIQFRLLEFEPDLIVLMHNINDRTVNYFLPHATSDYGNKYLHPFFVNPSLQTGLSLAGLLYQSRLLTRLGVPQWFAERRRIDFSLPTRDGLRYFERNLDYIAMVCQRTNTTLLLLSQPHRMDDFSYPEEPRDIEAYNRAIERVARDRRVAYLDMFTLMGHDPRYFLDVVHHSPAGVERFAHLLLPKVKELADQRRP